MTSFLSGPWRDVVCARQQYVRGPRWGGLRLAALLLLLGMAGAGCERKAEAPVTSQVEPRLAFENQAVRVVVFGDGALTEALARPAGEFRAQTGAFLEFADRSENELASADSLAALDADVVVFPTYLLGQLVTRRLIMPVPQDVLDNPALKWTEVLEHTRLHETVWEKQVYALPLGSGTLVCAYRQDLLSKLGRQPPQTWPEYVELATFLSDRKNLGDAAPPVDVPWYGTVEPLAAGWAGLTLLAHALPYAKHRDHYSSIFHVETLSPLIDTPPFVRALEELVAGIGGGPLDPTTFGPAECWNALVSGHCGLALTWPTPALDPPSGAVIKRQAIGFIELPGTLDVYNPGKQAWNERREPILRRVPLSSLNGRLAGVTLSCRYATAAWQLLSFLSTDPWSSQVGPASWTTTLFRESHLNRPEPWVGRRAEPASARRYAETMRLLMAREEVVPALCLPGRRRYVEELDRAVLAAVRGEQTPVDALRQAAAAWREITDLEFGVGATRRALEQSLGLGK